MWITKNTIELYMTFSALLFCLTLIFTPFCYCRERIINEVDGDITNLNNLPPAKPSDNNEISPNHSPSQLQLAASQLGKLYSNMKNKKAQSQDIQHLDEYQNTDIESEVGKSNINNIDDINKGITGQNFDEDMYQVSNNLPISNQMLENPANEEDPFKEMSLGMPHESPSDLTNVEEYDTLGQKPSKNKYPINPIQTLGTDKMPLEPIIDDDPFRDMELDLPSNDPSIDLKSVDKHNTPRQNPSEDKYPINPIQTLGTDKMPLEPIIEDDPFRDMELDMPSNLPSNTEVNSITNEMTLESKINAEEFQNMKNTNDQLDMNDFQEKNIDGELKTDMINNDLLDSETKQDSDLENINSNKKKRRKSTRIDKHENPLNKIKLEMPTSEKKGKKVFVKGTPFEFKSIEDSRVFCTFKDNVSKMYKKVKKHFVGDLCHAIVFGTPIVIHGHRIKLKKNLGTQLLEVHNYKSNALLIVIIKHSTYEDWSEALDHPEKEVQSIMRHVKEYHIDGIQFSNLQPTAQDQLDTNMLCKLIKFFTMLLESARSSKIDLKIGIGISSYSQSISTSFESFKILNTLVTWYSIHTISMVKCSSAHLTGTSPLRGDVSWDSTINQLISTNIDKKKIVIGIQLYPHKVDSLKPSTYLEMCLSNRKHWDQWCAERPQHFREKGDYLRNLEIWGVQLYYMESDDYKARCHCFSFPMIRALLRGLASKGPPENCRFLGKVTNKKSSCIIPSII